jgi:hypothetical protein
MLPSSIFGSSGITLNTGGVRHFLRFIWFRISPQRLGQLGRRSNIDGNTRKHILLCRLRTNGLADHGLDASTPPPRYERVTHHVGCKHGTRQHPSRGVGGFSFFSFWVYVMDIKRAGFGKREISCAYRMGLHFPRYFGLYLTELLCSQLSLLPAFCWPLWIRASLDGTATGYGFFRFLSFIPGRQLSHCTLQSEDRQARTGTCRLYREYKSSNFGLTSTSAYMPPSDVTHSCHFRCLVPKQHV